jgi:hypothetical protein
MFFYAPFFIFAAAMLLVFPDSGLWFAIAYVVALIGPRLLRRYRNW